MCKVTITDENGFYKSCVASNETPKQILEHYTIDVDKKIVYLNGKILSRGDLMVPVPNSGAINLAVRNKLVIR